MTSRTKASAPRLAFINTTAISLNQLMRGQLEYLQSIGCQIDLLSGGPDDQLAILKARNVGRVRYVPFRRNPHPLWDLICLLWVTLLLSLRRYDAVVSSTPKAMLVGSIAAFLTRQPRRIALVRGRGYENFEGSKRGIYVWLDRLTFRLSHKVLFVSRSLCEAFRNDGLVVPEKSQVIGHGSSNGVDLNRFRPLVDRARDEERRKLGLAPDDFAILAVGRITREKGSFELVEIARRLSDVAHIQFLLVGSFEDEQLRKSIGREAGQKLRWFPLTHEIERFFQCADLQLILSHREGFVNVGLEAAAAGVPTFAFDVVGVRDIVVPEVTGELFRFGDLDSLEQAIRESAADPSLRSKYRGARRYVEHRFDNRAVWDAYAQLFLGTSGR